MDNEILDAYRAGPHDLRVAVGDLTREHLVARPVPGKWTILEVVCHLADTEANIAHRLKRALVEESPEFERVQPDRMVAALAYPSREVDEELALIDVTRRQIARILQASPAEAWERAGVVNERGTRSVTQMLNGAVEHLAHHLRFIVEKRHALGLGDSVPVNLGAAT
jgi:DinB superfamily